MSEAFLSAVSVYGLPALFGLVLLSTFGLPVPGTLLVIAAGGLAAGGDMALAPVILAAFAAVVLGDQVLFRVARALGARHLGRLEATLISAALLARTRRLLERRGVLAVFLARTVLSPLGPSMTCTAGALGLPWAAFTLAAVPGAALWAMGYAALGVLAAEPLARLVARAGGLGAAAVVLGLLAVGFLWRVRAGRGQPSSTADQDRAAAASRR